MSKKIHVLLSTLLFLAILLSACATPAAPTEAPPQPTQAQTEPTQVPPTQAPEPTPEATARVLEEGKLIFGDDHQHAGFWIAGCHPARLRGTSRG